MLLNSEEVVKVVNSAVYDTIKSKGNEEDVVRYFYFILKLKEKLINELDSYTELYKLFNRG